MLQTTRALHRGLTALRAALVALHPQLILPLPRNRQTGELILDPSSHSFPSSPVNCYFSWVKRFIDPDARILT
jgi:hypothetical protein